MITFLRRHPIYHDYFITDNGKVLSIHQTKPHWMKLYKRRGDYMAVHVREPGIRLLKLVHCLVLETFVGPRPKGMEACHKNGISYDNRIENLRWDTHKENAKDVVRQGKWNNRFGNQNGGQDGEKNRQAKLKNSDIRKIKELRKKGLTFKQIGEKYDVSASNIYNAVKGISKFKDTDDEGGLLL